MHRRSLPLLFALGWSTALVAAPSLDAPQPVSYKERIAPLLSQYCYRCHGDGKHKGDVRLDVYPDETAMAADAETWQKVLTAVRRGDMPPDDKPQPGAEERELIVKWIERAVFKCDCDHPDPGRVTMRRLNRAEYNNTIRDLIGVDFQPSEDFPADDFGYGFDNIGDVLSLPPVLLEKYLAAAEKILRESIVTEDPNRIPSQRFDGARLQATAEGGPSDAGGRRLNSEGDVHARAVFPVTGEYLLRAKAYGEQAGDEPPRMKFKLGDRELVTFDVRVTRDTPQLYEVRIRVTEGPNQRFAALFTNDYYEPTDPDPKKRGDRNLIVDYLEVAGPLDAPSAAMPEAHRRIFVCQPAPEATPEMKKACAREIIAKFTHRAWRRPVTDEEVDRLARFVELAQKQGDRFERGVQLALTAVLVSPHFLFRGEADTPAGSGSREVSEWELASRLSYFLWSSMPDDELLAQAGAGLLRRNLDAQVERMLRSPKSSALVGNFAGQWLQVRSLKQIVPDQTLFPDFNNTLRADMIRETEEFFNAVMREDRPVLDFLEGKYTFVNERLARHYGIANVSGGDFRRVSLNGTPRAGVLTQGSVLTLTSNPTRTSPVKRGKWVLETLLGTPPPPPPPQVPQLSEAKEVVLSGTLRQRMEQHRADPTCASCHARMDPIGFGLENFDAVGRWRDQDGSFPVDARGKLVSGEEFKGPADLQKILVGRKRNAFVRCLAEKMLTYALGRGLEIYDRCAVDKIADTAAKNDYRFSSLVLGIVKSVPFQQRRGDPAP